MALVVRQISSRAGQSAPSVYNGATWRVLSASNNYVTDGPHPSEQDVLFFLIRSL